MRGAAGGVARWPHKRLSFILQFNLQNSYFILALPRPLGREKKLPSKATPGGRLGAGAVLKGIPPTRATRAGRRRSELRIVSPESKCLYLALLLPFSESLADRPLWPSFVSRHPLDAMCIRSGREP